MAHIFKGLLTLLLFVMGAQVQAQNIKVESDDVDFDTDTIAKTVLDYPQYRVYYDYVCVLRPDAKPLMGRKGITVLFVGKEYNMFRDYNGFRGDSILDVGAKKKWPSNKALNMALSVGPETTYDVVIFDRKNKKYSISIRVPFGNRYIYEEPANDMRWKLVPGDTIISNYKCKKATLTYRGRSYVAWYTEEIDMPYGPYKFNGLPGLLMRLRDDQKHHTFTFSGITKSRSTDLIYTSPRAFGGKREWIRQAVKNSCEDPTKAIMASGRMTLTEEQKKNNNKLPYNPIELE
ncbi:GLPGLI family protein [Porphyromonas cangingivalis]|uniref:GLPGLI family protein n=1 Tax=Porphyromonas cangingivalis TaxID=36874 RepID=UPI0015EB8ACD|nr:GLPGLI family protein [Porphyromonas cangingivalis]